MTDAILFEVSEWTAVNWLAVSFVLFVMAALAYEFVTWDKRRARSDEKEADSTD
jgi:hypothetical protein